MIWKKTFGGLMETSYANKLVNSLYWWLGKKRPFIINDEYKIDLLFIDKENNSAKIRVTNLKSGIVQETSVEGTDHNGSR
jgi:hypothetical protein